MAEAKDHPKADAKDDPKADPHDVHRDLKMTDPLTSGLDVQELQRALNELSEDLDRLARPHVKVDGDFGPATLDASHRAAWVLGLIEDRLKEIAQKKIVKHDVQDTIRHPGGRDDTQKARAEKRREWIRERLREEAAPKDGVATFDGHPVAAWMVEWLEKSRGAGWGGHLLSGYRTPEYSESICFAKCGAPSCPGSCAGRSSNHSGNVYPAGAVDVDDYVTFAAVQGKIGSPLKNTIGATDPNHFSVSGG